jgi:hypothetical protein
MKLVEKSYLLMNALLFTQGAGARPDKASVALRKATLLSAEKVRYAPLGPYRRLMLKALWRS